MSRDSSGPISVRLARTGDQTAWNAFVLAHPEGTFFHRFEWAEVLSGALGHRTHYLIAESGDRVVGVLPLAEVKSLLFGHMLASTPFCVYGGVLAEGPDAAAMLEAAAEQVAVRLRVDHLEFRNPSPRRDDWLRKDLYVTFRKALPAGEEAILNAIPRKARAEVRKGIKHGLRGEIDPGPERWYALYSESLRNLGTPVFTPRLGPALKQAFGDDCEFLVICGAQGPVAAVLSFYFRGEVLPYYGGGGAAARGCAANDFMYFELMRRASARGCTVFDFGRSKRDTGAHAFKKHMGFEETPLAYEYRLVRAGDMPDLSPKNAKYQAMIAAWRRLPLWASRLIGPPIARALG